MKLFKRTSIFLSIFIVLIWVSLTIWAYYPLNNVRVTDAEKQQTRQLLRKNNITALDTVFDIRIKAVSTPQVQYLTQNKKLFDEACKKGKLEKKDENTYAFDESELQISGSSVIITGKSDIIEKITSDTALAKSKKLIEWLNLSKKNMSAYVYEKMDGILVTFIPEYKGRRIFDLKVSVMMYGQSEFKVEAIPFELKRSGEKRLPVSTCSALAELALSGTANGEEIHDMILGYKTDGKMLKPVWEIEAANNIYYMD